MKKVCSRCKKQKDETDFPFTKVRGRKMRRSWCDVCLKAYYREYAQRRPKKEKAGALNRV